jgi:HEAT repeat protein
LLELEQGADLKAQCRYLDALGSLGKHGQSAVPRLREIVGGDQANERFARTRAAVALARIQDEPDEGLRLLIEWSRVDDPLTRWLAVDGLGRLPGPLPREAIDAVRKRLDDDNATVRTLAANALVSLKVDVPAAVDVLIGALGKRPSAVYLEPPGLSEEGPDTWHWAMSALARCGPHAAKAIPTLAGVLSHEDESYRSFALQALGKLGPTAKAALPEIERCSRHDRSPRIRKAAEQALQAIGSDEL